MSERGHQMFQFYLDKLCDDALVYAESFSLEMMPHQVSHRSDSTGGNGNLKQHGNHYELLPGIFTPQHHSSVINSRRQTSGL